MQFTADLLPSDVTGVTIYKQQSGEFEFRKGPLFANVMLADEINRAPAKVQSALLEAMAERQVTVGRRTHALPNLFMVMATQNPIEQEGTFPLPEAQLDRFLFKVDVAPQGVDSLVEILRRTTGAETPSAKSTVSAEELRAYQALLPRIRELGADFVAISPQVGDESVTMAARSNLTFEVLTDTGNSLAEHLGLAYELSPGVTDLYQQMGIDLERINGSAGWRLPIPATYVIDTDSVVVVSYVNPDYAVRLEPGEVIDALESLRG